MASSLAPECTPLKHEYDACFNTWFEGYLEPVLSTAQQGSTGGASNTNTMDNVQWRRDKAAEYDAKCGAVWKSYKECVQKAVTAKGLDTLIEEARLDNPLNDPPPPETADSKRSAL